MKAMLLAAHHDIHLHGYSNSPTLDAVLDYARKFTPLEVAMEKAGKRMLQVFPPYDLGFECCAPALLESVARQVKIDPEGPLLDPYYEFLKAAEAIRNFYRELSKIEFENTLLRKWVVSSLMAAARVHCALLFHPPPGTEDYVDDVDKTLRWLISWVPTYFSELAHPRDFHMTEAADSLACLGMDLLEHDRVESADGCAAAISELAAHSVARQPEPYALADVQQRLEVLARAADALGKAAVGVAVRKRIEKPATISDDDWPEFLEARQNRIGQLDRSLEERRSPYHLRDDPVSTLQRLLNMNEVS
jgi:hypothetical protein